MTTTIDNQSKFEAGRAARDHWAKPLVQEDCSISKFNEVCGRVFKYRARVRLDTSARRQTTVHATDFPGEIGESDWKKSNTEHIYLIVRGDRIMKIGGTRTGMKDRWSSYLCGHCVPQRLKKRTNEPFPGKMSVTNAHLYHTIEKDLLEGGEWSFWSWKLPTVIIDVDILGEPTRVVAQTYQAYESICMKKFRELAGHIPHLCDNSDPSYR